jgi:hypothetical protein
MTKQQPSPDFDFLMGLWRCRHRYLARRLADCQHWLEFDGTCAARKILDGYGNTDESDIRRPESPYKAITVRTFDPTSGLWSIYWSDSRTPGRLTPPVVGRFENGVGTFYGDDACEGQAVRVRFIWSGITPRSARWEQAFSVDGGRHWENNWQMDFTRM